MSANFSNGSLHFRSIPTTHIELTHISTVNYSFRHEFHHKKPTRFTLIICGSTIRPKRNSKPVENTEAQELVRTLLKNFNSDKPLLSTLNKYVKLVRTEHCFLLFEELGKSDKWLQCLEQEFEKMEQVFKSLLRSKERPVVSTFNSMITNYGKARLREKAEAIFQKITDMGYAPNFITYECMIMMYGCCGCVSKARGVYDNMIAAEKHVKVSTLNAMLNVYCMNGLAVEADKLFETACNCNNGMFHVDSSTYKLLYKSYTKGNMTELVQKLLKHMDRDGVVPNKRFFLDALGAVAS
ncbi:hypothetical protein E3N88_13551 [Mikania micrantha]|uniref:Pentacotripeptide-repeat region of PRORP domain-containing protein n=1 Tax=Mikania micrantha TaxID=192012 RepID=A0A5N6PAK5_9ASTR|nr:hypothetical protein E3N88_13551 [Mikania micrantha]